MAKHCPICNKQYAVVWRRVKLRGRYNPTIKRRQKPNFQWAHLPSGERILACAKCIKALGKKK